MRNQSQRYGSIMEMASFTSWQLYPKGKSPRCPLIRVLGGPHSQSGCRGLEEIWNWTMAVHPVAPCYTAWAMSAPLECGISYAYFQSLVVDVIDRYDLKYCHGIQWLNKHWHKLYIWDLFLFNRRIITKALILKFWEGSCLSSYSSSSFVWSSWSF
jgi:hypothetical protein